MSKIKHNFCSFCLKTENEETLIDTRTNLIQIEGKCYDFSTIYKDLLKFDPSTEFTCETCKDHFVQFFIFKTSIKIPQNSLNFIYSQIDDFLNQTEIKINDIKIIRTINSITLQNDQQTNEFETIQVENQRTIDDFVIAEEETSRTFEVMESHCCKECGKIETSDVEMEIHQFLRHSSFGIQVEAEIDNCKVYVNHADITNTLYICTLCSSQIENSDVMLLHFLEDHGREIINHINDFLMISKVDNDLISNYLNYIKILINGSSAELFNDSEIRSYFFQTYAINEEIEEEMDNAFDENVQEHSDIDITEETKLICEKKTTEKTNDLSSDEKEWIRNEISRGKCTMTSETGTKANYYRCTVSTSCKHISNSSAGLRYHLIMKHLKDRKNLRDERKSDETVFLTAPLNKMNTGKNCCIDCCLKFKDSRSHQLHEKCHELFQVVGQHSVFPMCSTCMCKFIDIESLNIHLEMHEKRENLKLPINVPYGAVREQGRNLKHSSKINHPGETSETEYSYKCGHCEGKYFSSEEFCNFHILMTHIVCFSCPIDRMEFSGFKSVSLFIHHLKNKHTELFPNLSFKCTFCQMEFSTIYDKLQHMKNCDSKQLQCDHCEKRFFKKTDLAAHLKIVTGEVQYECSICNKKCLSASDLKIHMRSHSKIKPYPCSLCDKSFRTLAARANHVESHNASQNYQCEYCEKTFKQRQMYRRHIKTIHERKSSLEQEVY